MSVSVCMIVKDEQHQINDAVSNFRKFADEIVVCDTGSGETTNAIIGHPYVSAAYKEKPFRFDSARNWSLSFSSSDWVMWLDADDRIDDEECQKLKKLFSLDPPKDRFFQLKVVNTIGGLPLGQQFLQTRIFPNGVGAKFEGAIHETVTKSLSGLKPVRVDIRINHTGYESEDDRARKAKRNIDILLEQPDDIRKYKALGDAYSNIGEVINTLKYYKLALECNPDDEVRVYLNFSIGLCEMKRAGNGIIKPEEVAIQRFNSALSIEPDNIDCLFYKAKCLEDLSNYIQALVYYKKAMEAPEKYSVYSSNYHYTRVLAYYNAARISVGMGLPHEAVELYRFISETYPKVAVE